MIFRKREEKSPGVVNTKCNQNFLGLFGKIREVAIVQVVSTVHNTCGTCTALELARNLLTGNSAKPSATARGSYEPLPEALRRERCFYIYGVYLGLHPT